MPIGLDQEWWLYFANVQSEHWSSPIQAAVAQHRYPETSVCLVRNGFSDTEWVGVSKIDLILDRFPERRYEIQQRFAQDAVFREICADYSEIMKVLTDSHEAEGALVAETILEHRDLLQELEIEIMRTLDRS